MRPIESTPELYAHAIAIEREAAERYAEFAQRMDDEGRREIAAAFGHLAQAEAEHLRTLERRTEGVALPDIDGDYKWLDGRTPEAPAHDLVMRLMTPRQAIAIALHAEQRAFAFFEHAALTATDPGARALAREMAAEEREHLVLLARLLEDTPSNPDFTLLFER
jgi:rubrerythrin